MLERPALERLNGAVVGNYRLDTLLEQNKWGPIFLASSQTKNSYVIRFIGMPLQDIQNKNVADAHMVFLGHFQQEANRVATLQHPHIFPLLDYGSYQGTPYLVYPHASLTSLRNLLTQEGAADPIAIGSYLDQLASALEYTHQHAIIHRNLSTSCIYIQANQQLVIAEFGLMRMHELSKQMHQPGGAYLFDGSSESSSPEQLLGKPVDARADIYALGAILYRLLTGHVPFTGKTREEIAHQHLYAEVPPIKTWREGLSPAIDTIITRAMAKEPLQRYNQPTAFARAYHQIVTPQEAYSPLIVSRPVIAARAPAPSGLTGSIKRSTGTKPPTQLSRRNMMVLLAGGSGLVAVSGIVVVSMKLLGGNSPTTASAATTNTPGNTQITTTQNGKGVLALSKDIPLNTAKPFAIANQHNPGVIIHLPNNKFVAYDSTCTHQACSVAYDTQDSLLKCPCHGAIFDPAKGAAVVQGPALTPLASIKIIVQADGTITT